MKSFFLGLGMSLVIAQSAIASDAQWLTPQVAQPSTCIAADFSSTGGKNWRTIKLTLTNNCGTDVDFQNSSVSFENGIALNTNFWGSFSPLSYPDNELRISSQPVAGKFLATFNLHFPTHPGAKSKLPAGKSFWIKYGAAQDLHVDGSTKVYIGTPVGTGNIELTNTSAKPANVTQTYALVHLTSNGLKVSDIQLPWSSTRTITGLAPVNYRLTADNITDSAGTVYQGTVTPSTINLTPDTTAKAIVNYGGTPPVSGKLTISLQALPTQIAGYTGKPIASVIEVGGSSSTPANLDWNQSTVVSTLKAGSTYNFSTPDISFNGWTCKPSFNPTSLIASSTAPTTALTYACSQVAQSRVTLNVTGAPTTQGSLKVTLTPNNNTAAVSQIITLTNGSGTGAAFLTTGVVYQVSADAVAGYNVSFNPQPLTAVANAVETITLTKIPVDGTPVSINGQLSVCGKQLCNQQGQPIQLKGMSTHGLQWYGWGDCVTAASLDALAKDFKASVVRISLYVQEGGYETNPAGFTQQVNTIIDEVSKRGMYALVDWHMLTPGDPNYNLERAKTFFTAIANANKTRNNLIYEIANEPNGVSWATIKSYSEKLIPVIRAIDPKTVILVGTRAWSSLGVSDGATSQEIISNPVNATNIMYTFHFYAASHKDNYLNELDKASDTLPMFVTEFGTQTYTGDGGNDFAMSDKYMDLMARKKISWTNWNYSDDFRSGAIWKTGTCSGGPWTDAQLKPAGVYIKGKIKG